MPRSKEERAAAAREYRARYPDRVKAAGERWRAANKDKVAARAKRWAEANPERRAEITRLSSVRNRERRNLAQQARYRADPEACRAVQRRWAAKPESLVVLVRQNLARDMGIRPRDVPKGLAEAKAAHILMIRALRGLRK